MGRMTGSVLVAVVSAILLTLFAVPASAQATRTWISGVGDDANPCSRTAPCKTFAGAISKTTPGGEIDCLDPGGFGALTITKAITLMCMPMSNGGVLVSGTNGIVVAAGPTDHVVLDGLDFDGLNSGLNGVNILSGLEVDIINSRIRNFTLNGVNMASSTANAVALIQNTFIENNGTAGTASTGGANVQGNGVGNTMRILNSVLEANANYSAQVNGSANNLLIANDFLGNGLSNLNSGNIYSYGPSSVITPATTLPNNPQPFK
jgi:hypothetical protein